MKFTDVKILIKTRNMVRIFLRAMIYSKVVHNLNKVPKAAPCGATVVTSVSFICS